MTGWAGEPVDLADLPLAELRAYRQRLRDEEDRVSYWRRLVHARLDLVAAGREAGRRAGGAALPLADVVRALGDTGTGRRREALHRVRAFDPLPDLPVLAEVWAEPSGDAAEAAALLARLDEAAGQLSAYRTAVHARLDAATDELVRRYHDRPALALAALTPTAGPS